MQHEITIYRVSAITAPEIHTPFANPDLKPVKLILIYSQVDSRISQSHNHRVLTKQLDRTFMH